MSLVGQPVEDASVGGGGVAAAASTTQQQQRRRLSSAATTPFRRSLNLTYGASALLARRFSRSRSNAAETPTPQPGPVRRQQRRSTISTTTAPPPQPAIATTTNQQQQKQPTLHVRIVPNIEDPSRSLIFNIVDRELSAGTIIKIGRFAERSQSPNHMSFKSKVVSRAHCEVWVDLDGKLYIRDTKSSSGTFLNHIRLSPANQESSATEIKHGDIVQLGVDYQGGEEEIYRSVKMRFEISASRRPRPLSFSMAQFNNLRTLSRIASNHEDDLVASPMALTEEKSEHQQQRREEERQKKESAEESKHAQANHPSCANGGDMAEVDECCICLYALAPFQALFVAPCSHSFHFKCIRSLLRSYPGFQCPICRTYSDLEASVAIEPEEVMEKYGLKCKSFTPPTDVMFDATWSQPVNPALQQPASDTTSTTSSSPSSSSSSSAQSSSAAAANAAAQTAQEERPSGDQEEQQEEHHRQENQCQHQHQQQQHSDEEVQNSLSADQPPVQLQETRVATIDQQIATDDMSQDSPNDVGDRRRTVFVSDNVQVQEAPASCEVPTSPTSTAGHGSERTRTTNASERRLSAANLVGKLKLNFFEKRKSMMISDHNQQQQQPQIHSRKRAAKARPLSYPNFLMRPFSNREDANSNNNNDNTSSNNGNNDCVATCSDLSTASSSQQRSVTLQSALTSNTLSRQSTTHLAEIEEEEPEELQRHIHHQPMEVDT